MHLPTFNSTLEQEEYDRKLQEKRGKPESQPKVQEKQQDQEVKEEEQNMPKKGVKFAEVRQHTEY